MHIEISRTKCVTRFKPIENEDDVPSEKIFEMYANRIICHVLHRKGYLWYDKIEFQ